MRDFFDDMWDDAINAPYDMGEMPGGMRAPTIAVPGPAEVADEFQSGSRDFFEDKADSHSGSSSRPRPRPQQKPKSQSKPKPRSQSQQRPQPQK